MAAPAARRPAVRPRRLWYLPALAVLLGGVAWLVVGLLSLSSQINSFPRVGLPASGSPVSLPHAGSYVVYYEAPGAASNAPPGFDVRIAPGSAGAAVTSLTPYGTSVTYSFGSRQGRAALTLKISSPGTFLVTAPAAPSGSDLAFGTSIAGGIVTTVVAAILLMLAGIAGLIVIFVIRVRRISRQRAAARGGMTYPGGPYPGPPGGPYPGGPYPGPHPGPPGGPYPGGP
jgi:hypothetical protein